MKTLTLEQIFPERYLKDWETYWYPRKGSPKLYSELKQGHLQNIISFLERNEINDVALMAAYKERARRDKEVEMKALDFRNKVLVEKVDSLREENEGLMKSLESLREENERLQEELAYQYYACAGTD